VGARCLYISYDGMLEPLGQSQVLGYLEKLATNNEIHLISFEKKADWNEADVRREMKNRIRAAGIFWHPRRYHKRFSLLATGYDICIGVLLGLWLQKKYSLEIIHARSYVPAVMALILKKASGLKFVFDMRGFWADERVDAGQWSAQGAVYRMAKWFERRFLLNADHVVSLTRAGVREMEKFPYLSGRMPVVSIIPTCADLEKFSPQKPVDERLTLGYVGTTQGWYVFDPVVKGFLYLQRIRPEARFLIVSRDSHDYIRGRLIAGGVPMDNVEIRSAKHEEVPSLIAGMAAAIFFIKPVFSKKASAPTKLAEFLGCGIPCLSNDGVGDMGELLESEAVGIAIQSFDDESVKNGVQRLLKLMDDPGLAERCISTAKTHFHLDEGVERYQRIYEILADRK